MRRLVLNGVLLLGGLALLGLLAQAAWRLHLAAGLVRASEPLQQSPASPALRLLVVGDSTAVGTGASDPAHSLVGLIAAAHPRLAVANRAQDGATWADLPGQLAGAAPADLVLIQAGGNDVMRLRDLDAVGDDVARVLARAGELAPQVLVMPAGNVGNARFFFPPVSWWMTARSRHLHRIVRAAAAAQGAVYVDLFEPADSDPFVQRPGLHAADGLHPSDAGYAVWYRVLQAQADLPARLAAAR